MDLLVPETVFAVGYNDDFIIAKSHPKNIKNEIDKTRTYYHIIEIKNINPNNPEQVSLLSKKQFEYSFKKLGVSKDLDFSIIIEYNK